MIAQCIQVKKYLPVEKQTRINLGHSLHFVRSLHSNRKAMSECMMAINTMYVACQDASINQLSDYLFKSCMCINVCYSGLSACSHMSESS